MHQSFDPQGTISSREEFREYVVVVDSSPNLRLNVPSSEDRIISELA